MANTTSAASQHYLGLARKWRPQNFSDLVGQSHIAQTLTQAIASHRVHHGYIFTGTRGIGKTSSARIFAKALRCEKTNTPGISCNACQDCLEIAEGRSMDVLEIDGASNNGVDSIREIRENAKFLPSHGKYKVYIVDEVHMLTTAAFNALLKTLEEPPAHVVFIFATTDPQKIPSTILSRCQRFDFKRVSLKDLKDRLQFICTQENVTIEEVALVTIAREAEGSMRDALSLLDQILAHGKSKITAQVVSESLGLIDKKTILDCMTAILNHDPLKAVESAGAVYWHGFDLKQFSKELLRMLRQLMVVQLLLQHQQKNIHAYFDLSDLDLDDLKNLSGLRSNEDLDMLFRILSHGLEDLARTQLPKIVLDVLLIKMASQPKLVPISLASTAISEITHSTPQRAVVAPQPAQGTGAKTTSQPVQQKIAAPNIPTNTATPVDRSNVTKEVWKEMVQFIREQKPLLGSILEHLTPESCIPTESLITLTLGYASDHSFYREQLQSKAYADLLGNLCKQFLGRAVRIDYREVQSNQSFDAQEQERRKKSLDEQRKKVLESEAFQASQKLLGARIEKLEIGGTTS